MIKPLERLALALGILLALGTPAFAHEDDYRRGATLDRQYGYERGYDDGLDHGRQDREVRANYDFRSEDFKHADRGYEKYMGDKGDYKNAYRRGYQSGYDAGFNRGSDRLSDRYDRDRYDRRYDDRYGYPDRYPDRYETRRSINAGPAFDLGYREGLEEGRKDRDKHKRFDPDNHGEFRDADHGYRSEYGSKELFRDEFRDGFLRGYREAYGRW